MNRKQFLLAAAVAAASAIVIYLLLTAEHLVPLVPFEEAPRPPVRAQGDAPHLTLSGLARPPTLEGNALRQRRNELAEEHARRLALWRDGVGPLSDAEAVEMELWVARGAVGEVEEGEMHAKLAELFAREHRRLLLLHESMLAGTDEVERAGLYVARERHRAGLPLEDPQGRDYETVRRTYLTAVKERHERLVDQGVGNREHLAQEYELLQDEFPPE